MRDPHHANMGFASMVNAADGAAAGPRLVFGTWRPDDRGDGVPGAVSAPARAKSPENLEFSLQPTWEIAFNHFHHRLGLPVPRMAKVIPLSRPPGADMNHIVWETLTHGEVGVVGLGALAANTKATTK